MRFLPHIYISHRLVTICRLCVFSASRDRPRSHHRRRESPESPEQPPPFPPTAHEIPGRARERAIRLAERAGHIHLFNPERSSPSTSTSTSHSGRRRDRGESEHPSPPLPTHSHSDIGLPRARERARRTAERARHIATEERGSSSSDVTGQGQHTSRPSRTAEQLLQDRIGRRVRTLQRDPAPTFNDEELQALQDWFRVDPATRPPLEEHPILGRFRQLDPAPEWSEAPHRDRHFYLPSFDTRERLVREACERLDAMHRVCAVCNRSELTCERYGYSQLPARFHTALRPPTGSSAPHPELRAEYNVAAVMGEPELANVMLSPRGIYAPSDSSIRQIQICSTCFSNLENTDLPDGEPPRYAIANHLFIGWPAQISRLAPIEQALVCMCFCVFVCSCHI